MLRHALRSVNRLVAVPLPSVGGVGGSSGPWFGSRTMAIWKSQSVRDWVGERALEAPTKWRPFKYDGKWRGPELSRRKQALQVKEAIREGHITLEPTLMVPPPKFKGHKRERIRPLALASIAAKMAEMPKLIAEYKQERRERRKAIRLAGRWK